MPKHKEYWDCFSKDFFSDNSTKCFTSKRFNGSWGNLKWEETYGWPIHIGVGRNTKNNSINVDLFVDKLPQNNSIVDLFLSRMKDMEPLFPNGLYPQTSAGKNGREPQEYFFRTIIELDDIEDESTWEMQIAWMKRQALQFRTLFDEVILEKPLTNIDNV